MSSILCLECLLPCEVTEARSGSTKTGYFDLANESWEKIVLM